MKMIDINLKERTSKNKFYKFGVSKRYLFSISHYEKM